MSKEDDIDSQLIHPATDERKLIHDLAYVQDAKKALGNLSRIFNYATIDEQELNNILNYAPKEDITSENLMQILDGMPKYGLPSVGGRVASWVREIISEPVAKRLDIIADMYQELAYRAAFDSNKEIHASIKEYINKSKGGDELASQKNLEMLQGEFGKEKVYAQIHTATMVCVSQSILESNEFKQNVNLRGLLHQIMNALTPKPISHNEFKHKQSLAYQVLNLTDDLQKQLQDLLEQKPAKSKASESEKLIGALIRDIKSLNDVTYDNLLSQKDSRTVTELATLDFTYLIESGLAESKRSEKNNSVGFFSKSKKPDPLAVKLDAVLKEALRAMEPVANTLKQLKSEVYAEQRTQANLETKPKMKTRPRR